MDSHSLHYGSQGTEKAGEALPVAEYLCGHGIEEGRYCAACRGTVPVPDDPLVCEHGTEEGTYCRPCRGTVPVPVRDPEEPRYSYDELDGNEDQGVMADYLGAVLQELITESETGGSVEVSHPGFQSFVTLRLANGAEWQITPVRSGWPDRGSKQFPAESECSSNDSCECDECSEAARLAGS